MASTVAFNPALLWKAPDINPLNHKARSIPALNPVNLYGRVFTFAWFGFMIAFWSWYVIPSLHHCCDYSCALIAGIVGISC